MPRTKLDKVFDNRFHESDITDNDNIDFHSENFMDDGDYSNPFNSVTIKELMIDIDVIIDNKFPDLKKTKITSAKRINKDDINIIYSYVKKTIPDKYNLADLWYYLAVYFDINSTRFYECLRDEYKMELIDYLYKNTELLNNKKMNKMF